MGARRGEHANGRSDDVTMTFAQMNVLMGRKTSDECSVLGNEVLIWQTVLEKPDVPVDGLQGKLVPNRALSDQAVLKVT